YGWTGIVGRTTHNDYVGRAVLNARVGANAGKLFVVDGEYGVTDNTIMVKIDSSFHMDYFWRQLEAKRLNSMVFGSGQPLITGTQIKNLIIPLPSTKAEQEAIAEALSDADALIESLEQLIAKKCQIKQGAMQELLTGKKRLPVFSGEWGETSLLELAAGKKELFDDGDWIESEHITSDGVRLIQTGNIGIGQFVEKEIKKYIFESSFVSLRCKELREGDLLICRLAEPAGRACVLPNIGEQKIVTSVDVTIFRPPSSTANRVFLANLFSTDQWFREVSDRSGGTTHKRISRGALGRLKIKVPALPEQTAIAAILTDMDAEISALEEKLAKTRAIKQGMMHNLLTGKIRLIDPAVVKVEQHALLDAESILAAPKPGKSHNWAFNEAVVIAVLADLFVDKPEFPLGRKRYTKLSYLMHRKAEQEVQGYLKKAAGPYNPKTKYSGPEKIAQENGYMQYHENGKYKGFIAGEKIEQAKTYFIKWYGSEIVAWLEQFRYRSSDDLELLATVDMAMQELLKQGKAADVDGVRALIASEPEWLPKLERTVFSDSGIAAAISECQAFFTM
ncbi:MAG: restriction endonuclease subunit S, partial [Methylobacter sp.]|nr:restriction endonuclease subunit S [Methylobacter sp.]